MNIIRGVFNEKDIEWDDLEEWFYLANNYPRSDEKVSENQNNIQKIITEKEKSIRLKLRKGTIIGDLGFVNVSTLSSIQLGQVLIGQIAFLNHLRESLSPYTMISFHNNVIKYLEDCNFVSNNVFQTSKFIDLFKQLFKYSQALFINIGLNSSKLNQMDLNFQSRLKKISSIKEFEMNLKSSEAYDNYSSLLTIIKLYDLILEEYYTFTVFFLSSALKANILTSTFCFGFEDYFKNINSIIQLREDKKQLYYQPNFFESNGE